MFIKIVIVLVWLFILKIIAFNKYTQKYKLWIGIIFTIIYIYLPVDVAVKNYKVYNVDNPIIVQYAETTGSSWLDLKHKQSIILIGKTPDDKYGTAFLNEHNSFMCDAKFVRTGPINDFELLSDLPIYEVRNSYILYPIHRDSMLFLPNSYICVFDILLK